MTTPATGSVASISARINARQTSSPKNRARAASSAIDPWPEHRDRVETTGIGIRSPSRFGIELAVRPRQGLLQPELAHPPRVLPQCPVVLRPATRRIAPAPARSAHAPVPHPAARAHRAAPARYRGQLRVVRARRVADQRKPVGNARRRPDVGIAEDAPAAPRPAHRRASRPGRYPAISSSRARPDRSAWIGAIRDGISAR